MSVYSSSTQDSQYSLVCACMPTIQCRQYRQRDRVTLTQYTCVHVCSRRSTLNNLKGKTVQLDAPILFKAPRICMCLCSNWGGLKYLVENVNEINYVSKLFIREHLSFHTLLYVVQWGNQCELISKQLTGLENFPWTTLVPVCRETHDTKWTVIVWVKFADVSITFQFQTRICLSYW